MKKTRNVVFVTAALLLILAPHKARGGAPAPRTNVRVRPVVPLGAPIRLQVTGNCMVRLPTAVGGRISVYSGNRRIPGRWVRERKVWLFRGVRFRFIPVRPLSPGRYTVKLRGRLPGLFFGRPAWGVRVLARKPTTPPQFSGLKGAVCRKMTRGHYEGCGTWQGISLSTGTYGGRYALYFRKWKTPYTRAQRWESSALSFNGPILQQMSKGRYLVTLLALDPADREGGKVCEVLLKFPRDNTCKGFRFTRTGRLGGIGGGAVTSLLRKARCAIPLRNVRKGKGRAFRSRWDRKKFTLP